MPRIGRIQRIGEYYLGELLDISFAQSGIFETDQRAIKRGYGIVVSDNIPMIKMPVGDPSERFLYLTLAYVNGLCRRLLRSPILSASEDS